MCKYASIHHFTNFPFFIFFTLTYMVWRLKKCLSFVIFKIVNEKSIYLRWKWWETFISKKIDLEKSFWTPNSFSFCFSTSFSNIYFSPFSIHIFQSTPTFDGIEFQVEISISFNSSTVIIQYLYFFNMFLFPHLLIQSNSY